MQYTKIHKHTTVEIITSGYDDRYLGFDSTITIDVIGDNDETAECRFQDGDEARNFLLATGMNFDEAWPIVHNVPTVYTMAAQTEARRWQSIVVTPDELQSVKAFLQARNSRGWTQEATDRQLQWLNAHPLSETLMAIVLGQLAECDRKNTEMWGHPHGYQAAIQAGAEIPE